MKNTEDVEAWKISSDILKSMLDGVRISISAIRFSG